MHLNFAVFSLHPSDGYGRQGAHMIRSLVRDGHTVSPMVIDQMSMPGWMQALAGYDYSRITVTLAAAGEFKSIPGRQWGYSMHESTKIPPDWIEIINQTCQRLITPSEWLIERFYSCGVKKNIPIHIVGEGIDPDEFPIMHRPDKDVYTFLALGDRGYRKGWEIAYRAFYKAFGDKQDVRLIVKARPGNMENQLTYQTDKRVSRIIDNAQTMADVYAIADCFVYPNRGDGWGLPPREAAATGLPVIATNWSGTSVGIEHWGIPIEKYRMVNAIMPYEGEWAEPDVDEVAAHMKWCYENREGAKALGLNAANWLRANQTWTHAARDLAALVEKNS